jgi:hypothetical protein
MRATSRRSSVSTDGTDRDPDASPAALTAAELAWIAALPCAAVTLAAVVVLGPPLGHALFAPTGDGLWPRKAPYVFGHPEPVKHARYALAVLGAGLLAAVVLVGSRRPPRLRPGARRAAVLASQSLACAGLVVAVVAQRLVSYPGNIPVRWRIFSAPTLVVACAAAAALVLALRIPAVAGHVARPGVARRRGAVACLLIAALATSIWLLPSVATEHTVTSGSFPDLPPWAMGDTYAVLDGRTPLVNFHALYSQLWAYVAAAPMAVLGDTIGVFTVVMTLISGLALLAVYAVLRRVVRSAPLALVLYLPFLATSMFVVATPEVPWRVTNAAVFSVWPMRYAGPWILAWLAARHVDRVRPRAAWTIMLVAGLVVVNNLEFGIAALAATVVALACVPERQSPRELGRLAASAAAGLLGAVLLISLLTLVRAGSLPHLGLLHEFPHLFGTLGLASIPMPAVGFHLALYATFAGALATAAVRVARGDGDVLLSAMLAWSGVFGLLAGSYFAGRSDPTKLAALFPAWGFALALLLVVVVRGMTARGARLPSPAGAAVLVGFGLAACSLAQVQAPWTELRRLRVSDPPAVYEEPVARRWIDSATTRGEHVAILVPMGHRIAYDLGIVNVSPYGTTEELATRAQFQALIDAMRHEDAHKLFLFNGILVDESTRMLRRAGFRLQAVMREDSYWSVP